MKWATPPKSPTRKPGRAYEQEAAKLRANPGQWALVRTLRINPERDSGRSVAHDIKTAKYVAFRPAGSFDAESHREWDENLGEIVLNIYAMYVGDPK